MQDKNSKVAYSRLDLILKKEEGGKKPLESFRILDNSNKHNTLWDDRRCLKKSVVEKYL